MLYVVENGKEFPLTPVAKRKSFFMEEHEHKQKQQDFARGVEPIILGRKQVKFHVTLTRFYHNLRSQRLPIFLQILEYHRDDCHLRSASPSTSSSSSSSDRSYTPEDEEEGTLGVGRSSCSPPPAPAPTSTTSSSSLAMVRASEGPYITEERQVLDNINLVSAMKQRFVPQ